MSLLTLLLKPFVPLAVRWVREQEAVILKKGKPLNPRQQKDARRAGVAHPEKIRVLAVKRVSPPQTGLLGWASKLGNAFDPDTAGCTLRYGIFIRCDCTNYRAYRNLHAHEFVHVGQYERYGSIQKFLVDYLQECIDPGYPHGPLEKQANRVAAKIVREG